MENRNSDPDQQERAALLYGMQRTGTNYASSVLLRNFENLRIYNPKSPRCLPVHKHFRLYDLKSAIPDERYYNTFTYPGFTDFKKHVQEVVDRTIDVFIVCIKDPYSWYWSYTRHARKNKYKYLRRVLNTHYFIDYNLFYRKWLDFALEAPDEVLMFRFEDLIEDLNGSLQRIGEKFNLEKSPGPVENPRKVHMSREFTRAKASYYKEKKYLDLFNEQERSVIQHLLEPELLASMNYQFIR